jgi:hypothetical protein
MTTMIKNIIEKIIMTTFGKFVRGIEKDKLSVDLFGGNFKLENISLNHDFFDTLDLPFTLTYSSIGKLNLQVPPLSFRRHSPNYPPCPFSVCSIASTPSCSSRKARTRGNRPCGEGSNAC